MRGSQGEENPHARNVGAGNRAGDGGDGCPAVAKKHGGDKGPSVTKSSFGTCPPMAACPTPAPRSTSTPSRIRAGCRSRSSRTAAFIQSVNVAGQPRSHGDVALGFKDIAGYTSPAYLKSNRTSGRSSGATATASPRVVHAAQRQEYHIDINNPRTRCTAVQRLQRADVGRERRSNARHGGREAAPADPAGERPRRRDDRLPRKRRRDGHVHAAQRHTRRAWTTSRRPPSRPSST